MSTSASCCRGERRRCGRGLAMIMVAAGLSLGVGACAGDEGAETEGSEALEPGPMRTVNVTPAKAAAGRGHFANCVACHGEEGIGILGTGPRLNSASFLEAASDPMLIRTIENGREGTTMIPWGETFSERQIGELIAYIRTFEETEPAELDESPLEGDVDEGQRIFSDICSMCHGRNGGGYQETAPGTGIGRQAFLDSVTNGYLRYIIEHGKDQTPMRSFSGPRTSVANLNDREIDSVIAYLRANAW